VAPVPWVGALAGEIVYVVAALVLTRAPFLVYWRLTTAPLYVLWKVGVYARMAASSRRGDAGAWVRTDRHEMKRKP